MTLLDRYALVLYLCVTVALAFADHRVRRDIHREHVVTEYIPSVIAGTSGAPAKYRVLMPFVLDRLSRWTGANAYTVFLVSEIVFIFASLAVIHAYLRFWYSPASSIGGTFAAAALLPLTFTNSWAHPDTFPDLVLFTAGCLAVAARRDWIVAIILGIGMLNRETIGFVALLWLVLRWGEWRNRTNVLPALTGFGVCVVVYVTLRWVRGFEHYEMWMPARNLSYLKILPPGFDPYTRVAGLFWVVLLAFPAYLAFKSARTPECPQFFKAAFLVAAVFVLVAWLFAAIIETRVFTPVMPLLLPGALAAFTPPSVHRRRA
jgi:hypothetical protein